jgi:hypothetical protein
MQRKIIALENIRANTQNGKTCRLIVNEVRRSHFITHAKDRAMVSAEEAGGINEARIGHA